MILALAAAAAAAVATPVPATSGACPDLVTPAALICRATRAQADGDSAGSAQAFEQAAVAAGDGDPATARMWAAAGNMWIAAGENGKAAVALDKALAMPGLLAEQRGEALLDRARVAEAQNDLKTARAKLDEAAPSIPDDPFYWYFSSALALREGDAAKAESAINHALSLAPKDSLILFEAGHVAEAKADSAKARTYWQQAVENDPNGEVGTKAREAIHMLDTPAKDDAAPAKP